LSVERLSAVLSNALRVCQIVSIAVRPVLKRSERMHLRASLCLRFTWRKWRTQVILLLNVLLRRCRFPKLCNGNASYRAYKGCRKQDVFVRTHQKRQIHVITYSAWLWISE